MEEKENKQKLDYKEFWDWFVTMERNFYDVVKEGGQESIEKDFLMSFLLNSDRSMKDIISWQECSIIPLQS